MNCMRSWLRSGGGTGCPKSASSTTTTFHIGTPDGGLCVELTAHAFTKSIGAEINLSRKLRDDELLFGECQSVIIVTINEENLFTLVEKAQALNVYTQTIGKVTSKGKLIINDLIDIGKDKLNDAYFQSLEKIMKS